MIVGETGFIGSMYYSMKSPEDTTSSTQYLATCRKNFYRNKAVVQPSYPVCIDALHRNNLEQLNERPKDATWSIEIHSVSSRTAN
jgi:hypothetical protein